MRLRHPALAVAAVGLAGALASPAASPPPLATALSGVSDRGALRVSDGASAPRTTGAPYRFATVLDSTPVRWNPCAPLHWRFRTTDAPSGGATVVRAAIARVARATGTSWVLDGTTTSAPATALLPATMNAHRPVVIGWTDASHSDLLRGSAASVLGVTRTRWFGVDDGTTRVAAIQGAVIALDATEHLPLTGRLSWRTVLLHELGHAMGLDHAGDSRELMYSLLPATLTDLQAGDLAGLSRLGRAAGCIILPTR